MPMFNETNWQPAPETLTLLESEVHLFRVNLEQPRWAVNKMSACLSTEEDERADRFHFQRDRRRFTISRGVLRAVIGRYLERSPASIRFSYGEQGKPELAPAMGGTPLQFNVAHSHELALIAITAGAAVGVDLERIRELDDASAIAERYFSPRESAIFGQLPEDEQEAAFFNCWTRKEAFIKAIGEGLSFPLADFDVAFVPGEPARLLSIQNDAAEARQWSLQALVPWSGYTGAVAVRSRRCRLQQWHWPAEQTP